MNTPELQLAQAQEIARRTLAILDGYDFWAKTADKAGFWNSSLHRDLIKLAEGKELNQYEKERALMVKIMRELEDETRTTQTT